MFFQVLGSSATRSGNPEIGLGEYAQGFRVGPGTRLPRLPALCKRKKKVRHSEQVDPLGYQERLPDSDAARRRNYSSLNEVTDKVLDVLQDQADVTR